MDVFRSLYVLAEGSDYAPWIETFWNATLPTNDCLWQLLKPQDLRGEVTAWGALPHWTVLDALTVSAPADFADIVKRVCRLCLRPIISPSGLAIFGGTSLVVKCVSPVLDHLKAALIPAARHLIARMQLTDEEFQRAEWWIQRVGKDVPANLADLWKAREHYREAGSPPLPSARHFRLGFLVRLCKELARATEENRVARENSLAYFLFHAEPPWYGGPGSLHTTIASGLKGNQTLASFNQSIWPTVQTKLGSFEPHYLAILGEDPQTMLAVDVFDWLTETSVAEKRPSFKVIDRADFALP